MNKDKPLILVTNDDGLSAPDSELYCCYGRDWEVIVVALTNRKAEWATYNHKQYLFEQNIKDSDVITNTVAVELLWIV
jgi:broad specificity polyphosphatase/5'/3'-nucleotidase SurE